MSDLNILHFIFLNVSVMFKSVFKGTLNLSDDTGARALFKMVEVQNESRTSQLIIICSRSTYVGNILLLLGTDLRWLHGENLLHHNQTCVTGLLCSFLLALCFSELREYFVI